MGYQLQSVCRVLPLVDNNYTPEILKERLANTKNSVAWFWEKTHPHWSSRIEALRKRLWKTNYWALKMVKSVNRGMKSSRRWKPSGNQLYVHTFEQSTQYTACIIVTRSSDAQQLQDQLLLLQKTAFYARYGGVFAHVCKQLKARAESRKVDGWEMLQKRY